MYANDPSPQPSPTRGERVSIGRPLRDAGRRPGFTLTELLVVIAIIAMLVALTSVAVMRAMDTAKQTRMKSEVDQLDLALKAYKEKYGSYPPCNLVNPAANTRLKQHVARAFPRYNLNDLQTDLEGAGVDTQIFRPDQALVFWLRGFSPDPAHPFVNTNDQQIFTSSSAWNVGTKVARAQFFDFDVTRLASKDTLAPRDTMMYGPVVPSYFPAGVNLTVDAPTTAADGPFSRWSGGGAAYVYYDAASYGTMPTNAPLAADPNLPFNLSSAPFTGAGTAVPYWFDANGNSSSAEIATPPLDFAGNQPIETWANPDSFQIIATGGDGKYGAPFPSLPVTLRLYPTGFGYDTSAALADDDNVTNFSANARLGDARP